MLDQLSALAGRSYASTAEAAEAILKLIADQLGMRTTYLSRVDRDGHQVRIQFAHNAADGCGVAPGSTHHLEDSYWSILAGSVESEPVIVTDVHADPRFARRYQGVANPTIGSYIGVPITLADGTRYGNLSAVDPAPRQLRRDQAELLTILARFCATQIERDLELERRRAVEERLRQSQALYNAFMDHSPAIAYLKDAEGRYRYINNRFLQRVGRTRPEIIDKTAFDWLPANAAAHLSERDRQVVASGQPTEVIEILPTPSGEDRLWRTFRFPFISPRGEPHIGGVAIDVTESERARGQLHAVLDAASDAMVVVDPFRRFRMINHRFAEQFGVDPAAVIGQPFEAFSALVERTFEDAATFARTVAGSASDPDRVISLPVTQRHPTRRDLQMVSTPVRGERGEHLGRLYVFRDVTNEREVDRLKSEFVSLVSHELRTPLTSIKGFVDLLLEIDVERLSDEQREFLGIVQSNVDRLATIINDLLDLSRIEAGRLDLQWSEFDPREAIEDVVRSLRPILSDKGQHLSLDLPIGLTHVLADRARVVQILTNLISNAHKYTPVGGSITVTAHADARFLTIEVADTGIGLSEDDLSKLFTKFFRSSNRATQEVRGTGLGLAITRSLVEALGGQISATSQLGKGSTFRFTLLVAAGEPRPATSALARPRDTGRRRVLVVEDDPDNADLLRHYLEGAGLEVLVATTGSDAIMLVIEEQPDLITLDLGLPDMNGLTVVERLRASLQNAALPPIVVVSMLPDKRSIAKLGAVGHLTKPFTEAAVLAVVRHALNDRPDEPGHHLVATPPSAQRRLGQ